ncbi:MAG: phenylglyoxylate dehydrogenase [Clostridiales bacterium]|nr:phenylglyoxylate dehydrogenase [Clostridiales bacterium]MCF8022041.1 phenylglyoxylate dehydrogenase [Clostridiales bacterium]
MSKVMATTGNTAAAIGAALAKPQVIAAYPITPQSSVVENLAGMIANGELNSKMVEVESEHSAMSVVQGAAVSGARTFTATSAQGLALMYEPYFRMSTLRLPMVMAIAGREMTSPETVWGSQQDSISVRDAGWLQMYVEDNQEILDMIIQGYKVAENQKVLLPINIIYDGFFLSHLMERVEVPPQEKVDQFLPGYNPQHVKFNPSEPMAVDPLTPGDILMEYREDHLKAAHKALEVIDDVDNDFGNSFGRYYGGAVQEYLCDDADIVLVTMGSMTGTAKEAVNIKREQGIKAGLLKIRAMRPFPETKVNEVLKGKKAVAVVDRNVCFGWNTGTLFVEVKAALNRCDDISLVPVIGGLGGADITLNHFTNCIDLLQKTSDYKKYHKCIWFKKGGELHEVS